MTPLTGRGLIIAAPSSGSGKTVITLGLLRALQRKGVAVRGAKSGPDYIDVRFHEAASRVHCVNLDAWAMPTQKIKNLAAGPELLIIEGAMGLFDGAPPNGKGAVADLARDLHLPVILVVDASRMAHSIAPLVQGFARHSSSVQVVGVILNRVGSDRHEAMLRQALETAGVRVLGALRRQAVLSMPSRHLGLVQAREHSDLEGFLNKAANVIAESVDLEAVQEIASGLPVAQPLLKVSKTGRKMAIAQDAAFDFVYRHHLQGFTNSGWQIASFSPLENEAVPEADIIFLPGGYPELHAAQISSNSNFINSLKKAAETTVIYGECGGYMVLGETLTDANGVVHKMAGLLPLKTSFADRKLHLGYRNLTAPSGPLQGHFKAHEFHYATTLKADGPSLFDATDASGTPLESMGLKCGRVCGSFAHLIERTCSPDAEPIPLWE